MNADEFAVQCPITVEDAQIILDAIKGSVLWKPEMMVELVQCGWQVEDILKKLENNPMYLLGYLAIQNADNPPSSA